jgi:A/G-specific adenine glycosylase
MNAAMGICWENVTVPFAQKLIAWQRRHGRRDLPWQGTRDPYRIWLSEVMLQQTQVATVIPYYERFLQKYPSVDALAEASEDEVLRLWSGLGYYARGRNLLRAAKDVASRGQFPDTAGGISELPGVGRSTAAAIAVFAFGRRAAILDGNVKRVLARCFGVEGEAQLWGLAERLLPKRRLEAYTQALMDLGARVCVRGTPKCRQCPVESMCYARANGLVERLPARRPRKALPLRRTTWLVLRHAGEVLLERRPGSGVWGGLWSFPERSRAPAAACRELLGYELARTRRLQPIEHGFTHFRLHIRPVLCEVARRAPRAQSPGYSWIDVARAGDAALPAPVRRLLAAIAAR